MRSALFLLPLFVLSGPPVRAQLTPPAVVATISTGQEVALPANLQPQAPTVFVFYNDTSSADKSLVETLTRRAGSGVVGLRLIRLSGLDSPAARQHEIRETPTVLVLDRFGKLLARTSRIEEIDAAVRIGLRAARLKWVDERDPAAPEVYKNLGGGQQPVGAILKTMSLQPGWMDAIAELSRKAHFSDTHLPRRTKELIATYVSALNRCKY